MTIKIHTIETSARITENKVMFSDGDNEFITSEVSSSYIGMFVSDANEILDICTVSDLPNLIKALQLMQNIKAQE